MNRQKLRLALNIVFLILAVVGFILYFQPAHRDQGLIVIVTGMVVKVIEFLVRFLC